MDRLEIDSVTFSYGSVPLLSDVYLTVEAGEVVGILGRNGCGKSTLLKIIFGILRGENQSIRINGVYLSAAYRSRKIGFQFQDDFMPANLTIDRAIHLFDSDSRIFEVEEVRQNRARRFSELSSGASRFIQSCILLYGPYQFVLLDEPFSYLSPVLGEKLSEQIARVAAIGKGIVLTDHRYEAVMDVADHLYLMREQRIHPVVDRQELVDFGYIRA